MPGRGEQVVLTMGSQSPTEDAANGQRAVPMWINGWGVFACLLPACGLLSIPVVGSRSLTIAAAGCGTVAVVAGIVATWRGRSGSDCLWLTFAGVVNGSLLLLAFFFPGALNPIWALDIPVTPSDPHKQVVVHRDLPRGASHELAAQEWVDASTQAILQDDVLFRLNVVSLGRLPDQGANNYLLVQFRIASSCHTHGFTFEGFANDQHRPILVGESGHTYKLLELRPRKLDAGPPMYFEPSPVQTVKVMPTRYLDYVLVFEPRRGGLEPMKLELPAAAWGRKGACRFHISGPFEAMMPILKAKEEKS